MQIDCTEWLAGVDHDADGMMRVATLMASMHRRPRLSNDQVLPLLQRLGCALLYYYQAERASMLLYQVAPMLLCGTCFRSG
jgi:hypothetical protein